jgi:hypothetical protein
LRFAYAFEQATRIGDVRPADVLNPDGGGATVEGS